MSDLSRKASAGTKSSGSPVNEKTDNVDGVLDQGWLLPPPLDQDKEKKCLVLDLDETLLHSSFKVSI